MTTQVVMNKQEAKKQARELRAMGLTYSQISSELTNRGYKNRNGSPVTQGSIHFMLKYSRAKKATVTAETTKTVRVNRASYRNFLGRVIEDDTLTYTQKIKLASFLVEQNG